MLPWWGNHFYAGELESGFGITECDVHGVEQNSKRDKTAEYWLCAYCRFRCDRQKKRANHDSILLAAEFLGGQSSFC